MTMVVQPIVDAPPARCTPTRRWPASRRAAATARCTGSRSPTSSGCGRSSSWPACAPRWGCSMTARRRAPQREPSGPGADRARAPEIWPSADVSRLIVEVTEEALVERDESFVAALAPLMPAARTGHRRHGRRLLRSASDHALHPSYLKLDRSLVRDIDADARPRSAARGAGRLRAAHRRATWSPRALSARQSSRSSTAGHPAHPGLVLRAPGPRVACTRRIKLRASLIP